MKAKELMHAAPVYPFSAIVGQERAKRAILLYFINPASGGVLLSGSPGAGKSLLLRGAAALLGTRRSISVPANVTADRLLGAWDAAAIVQGRTMTHQPGLLAEADGQLLLTDHLNLLPETIIKEIVRAFSMGVIHLHREGISAVRSSRFMLLAAMDAEEGGIPSPILDHFGYGIALDTAESLTSRVEIIRRQLQYERDPDAFVHRYRAQDEALRQRMEAAARTLPRIKVGASMLQLAASIAKEAGIASSRAELALIEGARAAAAWDERGEVTSSDIREIAECVLPHRMSAVADESRAADHSPAAPDSAEQPGHSPEDDTSRDSRSPDGSPDHAASGSGRMTTTSSPASDPSASRDEDEEGQRLSASEDRIILPDDGFRLQPLDYNLRRKMADGGLGKRGRAHANMNKGRVVGAVTPHRKVQADVAFDATIRAAAPFQTIREKRDGLAFAIEPGDLRQKKKESSVGASLLFVVDASGSMAARKRMAAVKGGILSLLQDAYVKRDRIGMIAFRKGEAEYVLPITRSVDAASKHLRDIPTGGKTPLTAGLVKAYQTLELEKRRNNDTLPMIILVTDGRANESPSGLTSYADVWKECLSAAEPIRASGIPCLVLDTEQGFVKLGRSKELAQALGAAYRKLENMDEEGVATAVRLTKR
ncbi:VWA domain-containing protein [Paenibacillus campinasensis]|uniref:Magnesium chelatase n=1 Tax=Paenibacillus campinasensis TaxID=66347 RepID=A0A268EV89_9BACL|nr:VWA domain-containing protein [Paenibacillus campinasensis]PAD77011.1 magnesium chelatase [Paenibacillus campinasensis]